MFLALPITMILPEAIFLILMNLLFVNASVKHRTATKFERLAE